MRDSHNRSVRSYQELQASLVKERQEEIREENKLARSLTSLSLQTQEGGGLADFRRRKVRWHF